ncbi:2-amino-4-hydroxy-6-hydroxymethyldihydropteridine diphosphokinase [Pseudoclavibacter sp. 8L]|uniref:2-amino-4-hydroxy-6- hydroxymethyldihydropteridine diphosphokinase n=1 Tax=Pseudoclavibacter sp. 8L TaxID=2653162 RepID=UPI0012EF4664|nr:2-amino-4-hydroxy-6-hydroxymethyldihydropteridine diphosphokinase [Pseudoclavibacter sp. 8L]VXC46555.1 7,8-dihydroneopterin aldolase [Pseudoclavibacter sp. 8L]
MTDHMSGHEPDLDRRRGAEVRAARSVAAGGQAHEHAFTRERVADASGSGVDLASGGAARAGSGAPGAPTPTAAAPSAAARLPGAPEPELDRILITRMHARGHHGVFDHERRDGQDFYVDAEAWVDAAAASSSDHIGDTLHYGEWMHALHAIVTGEPVDLIETLAERLASATFGFDDAVAVRITVHKPQAPVALDFEDVAVSILRHRPTLRGDHLESSAAHAVSASAEDDFHAREAAAAAAARTASDAAIVIGSGGAPNVAPAVPTQRVRQAVIALGANLGDREATLRSALQRITELPGTKLIAASSLYETPALTLEGVSDEAPAYRNAVVLVDTELPAAELLQALHVIEDAHGRTRETRWGSRTLDLDLIQVAGEVSSGELVLPHPRAHERAFVLAPWLEVDPRAQLAPHGSVAELRAAAEDRVERIAQ